MIKPRGQLEFGFTGADPEEETKPEFEEITESRNETGSVEFSEQVIDGVRLLIVPSKNRIITEYEGHEVVFHRTGGKIDAVVRSAKIPKEISQKIWSAAGKAAAEMQKEERETKVDAMGDIHFGDKKCKVMSTGNWKIITTSIVEASGEPTQLFYNPKTESYEMAPGQMDEPGLIDAVSAWVKEQKASKRRTA